MGVKIDYKLTGHGWAECTIDINGTFCTTTASYLSDCLKGFIDATCAILKGDHEARFVFDEEPGEYRWILNSTSRDAVKITILAYDKLWGEMSDAEGKIIFETAISKHDFATELKASLDRLLAEHGLLGYEEKWDEHQFPVLSYQELCALLDVSSDLPELKSSNSIERIK